MEATEHGEKGELRAKLDAAVEKAKAVCERLQEQTVAAAQGPPTRPSASIRIKPLASPSAWAYCIGVLVARGRRGRDRSGLR